MIERLPHRVQILTVPQAGTNGGVHNRHLPRPKAVQQPIDIGNDTGVDPLAVGGTHPWDQFLKGLHQRIVGADKIALHINHQQGGFVTRQDQRSFVFEADNFKNFFVVCRHPVPLFFVLNNPHP